jgi:hypothetical protein
MTSNKIEACPKELVRAGKPERSDTEDIAHSDKCASNSIATSSIKAYCSSKGEQITISYKMNRNEVALLLKSGKTLTAKQISQILVMPLPEVQQTLSLMVKLNEVVADTQALTYYHLRRVEP